MTASPWSVFLRTAERHAHRPALCDRTRSYTYAQLAAHCVRLAATVRARGVGTGDSVLVCADRTVDAVVAILAVVAAGGTPVPVEPGAPARRVEHIVRISNAAHAVVDDTGAPTASGLVRVHVSETAAAVESGTEVTPSPLAYVLFTSGSTGVPKGVDVTAAGLLALLAGAAQWDSASPGEVWAGVHAFTFDISMWEMWRPLTVGARLVVLPARAQADARHAHALLTDHGVEVLCQTPTAVRMLADHCAAQGLPPRLRRLLIAGERLDFATLTPFAHAADAGRLELWNLYGPTEATVYASGHRIRANDIRAERRSLIGHALPHVRLHLPAPAADGIGELCIGGPGLAAGYRGDPDRTRACFVDDPALGRMYRTGDLVRETAPGAYEFISRAGGYVKIRGYRVEPGDIVHALCAHPAVARAAVVVTDAQGWGDTIVGVVVAAAEVTDLELRRHLAELLPPYLRPARLLFADTLPTLPSGKLDAATLRSFVDRRLGADPPERTRSRT
ncbi:amino acid adenylation domain-containing protein [Nocardia sp. NPDC003482]